MQMCVHTAEDAQRSRSRRCLIVRLRLELEALVEHLVGDRRGSPSLPKAAQSACRMPQARSSGLRLPLDSTAGHGALRLGCKSALQASARRSRCELQLLLLHFKPARSLVSTCSPCKQLHQEGSEEGRCASRRRRPGELWLSSPEPRLLVERCFLRGFCAALRVMQAHFQGLNLFHERMVHSLLVPVCTRQAQCQAFTSMGIKSLRSVESGNVQLPRMSIRFKVAPGCAAAACSFASTARWSCRAAADSLACVQAAVLALWAFAIASAAAHAVARRSSSTLT